MRKGTPARFRADLLPTWWPRPRAAPSLRPVLVLEEGGLTRSPYVFGFLCLKTGPALGHPGRIWRGGVEGKGPGQAGVTGWPRVLFSPKPESAERLLSCV